MIKPARTQRPVKPAPLWMSVDAAVPYLGVPRDTIYRAFKAGTLTVRAHRIGRRVLLSHADVMAVASRAA